jgi:ribonuclease T2
LGNQPLRTTFGILIAGLLTLSPLAAKAQDRAGAFDFFVLSLSWSPTFCATGKAERNRRQCGSERNYGFIVHGLWPQFEKGYPEFCDSREPGRVPQALGEEMFDIMPSMGLIGHQWRKHGRCTGLSQRDYFARTREAFGRITLPPALARGDSAKTFSASEIEQAFVESNPGLSLRGIAASCEGRQLEEIRICLTKDLQFRDCAEVDRGGCRAGRITLPPIQ